LEPIPARKSVNRKTFNENKEERKMVKIRLVRLGAKKRPFYRLVAIDERKKTTGRPLEFLGTYDPKTPDAPINIRTAAVDAWIEKGAMMSPTAKSLVARARRDSAATGGTA
jgi:small subunit ribosomal protein S16